MSKPSIPGIFDIDFSFPEIPLHSDHSSENKPSKENHPTPSPPHTKNSIDLNDDEILGFFQEIENSKPPQSQTIPLQTHNPITDTPASIKPSAPISSTESRPTNKLLKKENTPALKSAASTEFKEPPTTSIKSNLLSRLKSPPQSLSDPQPKPAPSSVQPSDSLTLSKDDTDDLLDRMLYVRNRILLRNSDARPHLNDIFTLDALNAISHTLPRDEHSLRQLLETRPWSNEEQSTYIKYQKFFIFELNHFIKTYITPGLKPNAPRISDTSDFAHFTELLHDAPIPEAVKPDSTDAQPKKRSSNEKKPNDQTTAYKGKRRKKHDDFV